MSIFSKFTPISTALLPNAEADDIRLVLSMFLPWNWAKWYEGKEAEKLENKFKEYFGVTNAISFSFGRAGLFAILKSLSNLEPTTYPLRLREASNLQPFEIILQAYTTIALPLAIKKAGFKPVYVDISEHTYNIDPDKIEAKINSRTRAIIVQHTFGIPAEMDKISEICKKHNLILIEDCAHSLGVEFNGKKIGTFGDAAFFSFGRDKIISSTSGGMVIAKNEKLVEKIKEFQSSLDFPPIKFIFQQLMHPLVFWVSLPVYYFFNIGKFKIFLDQKLGIISRAYSEAEKKGIGTFGVYRLPNVLAILASNQFKKLERFNNHRRNIAEMYDISLHFDTSKYQNMIKLPLNLKNSKPVFLYYTIQIRRRDELLKYAAKNHIILGDWFPCALGPKGVDDEKFGYKKGDCPTAERVGLKSLNLPTNIKTSKDDAENIASLIKSFLNRT